MLYLPVKSFFHGSSNKIADFCKTLTTTLFCFNILGRLSHFEHCFEELSQIVRSVWTYRHKLNAHRSCFSVHCAGVNKSENNFSRGKGTSISASPRRLFHCQESITLNTSAIHFLYRFVLHRQKIVQEHAKQNKATQINSCKQPGLLNRHCLLFVISEGSQERSCVTLLTLGRHVSRKL